MLNIIKKYKPFILILTVLSFAIMMPQEAYALPGTGLFDFSDAAMNAVEETTGPVVKAFFDVLVLYCIGWVAMFLSSKGVDYLMQDPNGLLTLADSEIVKAGWNFTSGLANLIIVVLFVVVALAFIMKWEKFEPKKAIVRLIVAALLVNFSFLFCQILVDVSNILMNSFVNVAATNGDVAQALAQHAMTASGNQISSIVTYLVGLTLAGMTVFLGPVVQAGVVTTFATALLPNVLNFFVQLGISFLLSSVFLTYFTVLLLRIAIVQIFTIVAPLAVICFVLPQTKKLGEQWLNGIIHWSLFTVPLSFFLMLGTFILKKPVEMSLEIQESNKLFGFVDGFMPFNSEVVGTMFATYFLLAIFLIVALMVSKKMIPKEITEVINEVKSQSKYFQKPVSMVAKPMAYGVKKDLGDRATGLVAKGDELPPVSGDNSFIDNATRLATRPASLWRKWTKAPTAGQDFAKITQEEAGAFSEETTAIELDKAMNKVTGSSQERLAMISKMKSEEIGNYLTKATPEQEKRFMGLVKTLGDKSVQEKVLRASILGDENDERRLMSLGGPVGEDYGTKLEEVIAKSTGERALDINVGAIARSEQVRSSIAKHWTGNEFGTKGKKDNKFIEVVNTNYNEFVGRANGSLKKYLQAETGPYCDQSSKKRTQESTSQTQQTTLDDFSSEKRGSPREGGPSSESSDEKKPVRGMDKEQ